MWARCPLDADDATVVEVPDLIAAIGEPAWVDGDDIVIPPAWDSLEKVRAMTDAHMLDFDALCTEADTLISEAERIRLARGSMTESKDKEMELGRQVNCQRRWICKMKNSARSARWI